MLRIFMHNGTIHNIPLIDRTAEGLAEQLSFLLAAGGNVLAMRVEDDPADMTMSDSGALEETEETGEPEKKRRGRPRKTTETTPEVGDG
jgi:hypothetical protein